MFAHRRLFTPNNPRYRYKYFIGAIGSHGVVEVVVLGYLDASLESDFR